LQGYDPARYPLEDVARRQRKHAADQRPVLGALLVIVVVLLYGILLGHQGIGRYLALQKRLAVRSADASQRIERNRLLRDRLEGLRTNERFLEEVARSTLGVVRQDELVLVFRDHRVRNRP